MGTAVVDTIGSVVIDDIGFTMVIVVMLPVATVVGVTIIVESVVIGPTEVG